MRKQYNDFNKSTWWIFPIIADEVLLNKPKKPKDPTPRDIYLIDTHLINTYVYPSIHSRMLYVKYDNHPNVVDIEPYLTCDYLEDIKYNSTSTTYIYNIKINNNPQSIKDIINYDYVIEGLYSKTDLDYRWKMFQLFNLDVNDYIAKIFRKDNTLWHEINKQLSCIDCKCKLDTFVDNKGKLELKPIQRYLTCKNYKSFTMPKIKEIELEAKFDINKETIIL